MSELEFMWESFIHVFVSAWLGKLSVVLVSVPLINYFYCFSIGRKAWESSID